MKTIVIDNDLITVTDAEAVNFEKLAKRFDKAEDESQIYHILGEMTSLKSYLLRRYKNKKVGVYKTIF